MNIPDLLNNPVFTGVFGASVSAGLMYALRGIPSKIYEWIRYFFVTEVLFFSEDETYHLANEWLGGVFKGKNIRKYRLSDRVNYNYHGHNEVKDFATAFQLTPGHGTHFLLYKKWFLIIHKNRAEKGAGMRSSARPEDLFISSFGPKGFAEHLSEEIKKLSNNANVDSIKIFSYKGGWSPNNSRLKRPMDSVFIPEEQKTTIVNDIQLFIDSRKWYEKIGIPYRRGILLAGPPGCGKSTIVFAIASLFSKPIYALNIGGLDDDNDLITAISGVPQDGILLIEDIDAATSSVKKRNNSEDESSDKKAGAQITLSALLNSIDGIFAQDGRIIFMTTNHPEKIDPALIRPGRADLRLTIEPIPREIGEKMAEHIFGDKSVVAELNFPMPAVELQEFLLRIAGPTRGLTNG